MISRVCMTSLPSGGWYELGWRVGWRMAIRSFFSMCSRVVFPALSSPRNRSLACLLTKPREERTS